MDFSLFIRKRLNELGIEQRDLAAAAQVTESYISQLPTGKRQTPTALYYYRELQTLREPLNFLGAPTNVLTAARSRPSASTVSRSER
jgi:transcriptional regulator with XRE-family HTH domain